MELFKKQSLHKYSTFECPIAQNFGTAVKKLEIKIISHIILFD